MPFNKTSAVAALKAKLLALRNNTNDADSAAGELAEQIVAGIADQVKAGVESALITPILVAPPGGGPVTGTITIVLTIV